MTWLAVAGAFLLASYIKGTTGMGFPLIATPMVAMLVDVRTAYALLLMPNILMDVFHRSAGQSCRGLCGGGWPLCWAPPSSASSWGPGS